jgi:hypothetical protein
MSEPFRLSVAVPVHNEERVLPELLRRVRAVLDQIPGGPPRTLIRRRRQHGERLL